MPAEDALKAANPVSRPRARSSRFPVQTSHVPDAQRSGGSGGSMATVEVTREDLDGITQHAVRLWPQALAGGPLHGHKTSNFAESCNSWDDTPSPQKQRRPGNFGSSGPKNRGLAGLLCLPQQNTF